MVDSFFGRAFPRCSISLTDKLLGYLLELSRLDEDILGLGKDMARRLAFFGGYIVNYVNIRNHLQKTPEGMGAMVT